MSDRPEKNTVNTHGSTTGGSELTPELPLREKPEKPTPYECCESGCTPCVWDVYYKDLRQWQAQQATLDACTAVLLDLRSRSGLTVRYSLLSRCSF